MIFKGAINGNNYDIKEMGLMFKDIKWVYTILNYEGMFQKYDPMTGMKLDELLRDINGPLCLIHGVTVCMEDAFHDWKIIRGKFMFNSHSSVIGSKVDLLIEYVDRLQG
jgi:hypothetical protein